MRRIFIALWPPPSVAARVITTAAAWPWEPGTVRYAQGDLHLTLRFIGPLSDDAVSRLRDRLHCPCKPFELVLDAPVRWPGGLAVLTPSSVPKTLTALHRSMDAVLCNVGHPPETREFAPHVTLARRCTATPLPPACPPIIWPVRQYVLVASTGDPQRRYEVLQRYGCGKTAAT